MRARSKVETFWDFLEGYALAYDFEPECDFRSDRRRRETSGIVDDYFAVTSDIERSIDRFCRERRNELEENRDERSREGGTPERVKVL